MISGLAFLMRGQGDAEAVGDLGQRVPGSDPVQVAGGSVGARLQSGVGGRQAGASGTGLGLGVADRRRLGRRAEDGLAERERRARRDARRRRRIRAGQAESRATRPPGGDAPGRASPPRSEVNTKAMTRQTTRIAPAITIGSWREPAGRAPLRRDDRVIGRTGTGVGVASPTDGVGSSGGAIADLRALPPATGPAAERSTAGSTAGSVDGSGDRRRGRVGERGGVRGVRPGWRRGGGRGERLVTRRRRTSLGTAAGSSRDLASAGASPVTPAGAAGSARGHGGHGDGGRDRRTARNRGCRQGPGRSSSART